MSSTIISLQRISAFLINSLITASFFGDTNSTIELDAEKIEYLVKKKSKLVNLLQDAIELNEPLYCSV